MAMKTQIDQGDVVMQRKVNMCLDFGPGCILVADLERGSRRSKFVVSSNVQGAVDPNHCMVLFAAYQPPPTSPPLIFRPWNSIFGATTVWLGFAREP